MDVFPWRKVVPSGQMLASLSLSVRPAFSSSFGQVQLVQCLSSDTRIARFSQIWLLVLNC